MQKEMIEIKIKIMYYDERQSFRNTVVFGRFKFSVYKSRKKSCFVRDMAKMALGLAISTE